MARYTNSKRKNSCLLYSIINYILIYALVKNNQRGKFQKILRFMAFSPWSPAGTFLSTELNRAIVTGYRTVYDTTRLVKPFGRYRGHSVQNARFTLVTVPFGPETLVARRWKFGGSCPLWSRVERCLTRQNRLTRSGVAADKVNVVRRRNIGVRACCKSVVCIEWKKKVV